MNRRRSRKHVVKEAVQASVAMTQTPEGAGPLADHVERLLDAALEQTFPASDPIAVDVPRRTEGVLARRATTA